jgi:hypothetical protein
METWDIDTSSVDDWLATLPQNVLTRVLAALHQLETRGPHLGRPYVDTVTGSRIHNLKELRPLTTAKYAIRVLFVFNSNRRVVLLVAGNKAGSWLAWYRRNIPIAEKNYDNYNEQH